MLIKNLSLPSFFTQFPKSMLLAKDLQELGLPSNETHLESVKRYSDFTRLHVQLQRTPELVKHIEGELISPSNRHIGTDHFVHYREVVLFQR